MITRYIRKSRVRIEDTLFWIILSILLMVVSFFPEIAFWFSRLLEVQSPINFIFLLIIFILLVNQFYMSIKMSQLKIKFDELVQKIAIAEKDRR